jgi:hypothetical protein
VKKNNWSACPLTNQSIRWLELMLQYGSTAVNVAAEYGQLEIVSVLLEKGACIATPDNVSFLTVVEQQFAWECTADLTTCTTAFKGSSSIWCLQYHPVASLALMPLPKPLIAPQPPCSTSHLVVITRYTAIVKGRLHMPIIRGHTQMPYERCE